MKDVTPPRLARALLRLVVPKHDRTFVVEDLDEEFAVLAAEGRSDRYLRHWYWGQVRSSMLPSLKRPRVPPLRRRTWSDIMHSVIHDVRYAFRTLFRQPAYALTVRAAKRRPCRSTDAPGSRSSGWNQVTAENVGALMRL